MSIGTSQTGLWVIGILFTITLFCSTTGRAAPQKSQDACNETIVKSLTKQCRGANKLKNLEEFYNLFKNFDHLTNKCLRPSMPRGEPNLSSLQAEDECKHQKLLFYQVRHLAELVARWHSNQPVCTLEFTMRVYNLHHQIKPMEHDQDLVLSRMLRLLANSIAWKCRFTLVQRLKNVEGRAPDSQRHIGVVIGLINVGSPSQLLSRMTPLERVDRFVPILERELPGRSDSIRDGYQLKSANSVRLSYGVVKVSCDALKQYHVNLLGSLGLLSSLGYSPISSLGQQSSILKLSESRTDQELMMKWLLSAMLCQSLRTVERMQELKTEEKLLHRFVIMPTQEADVSLEEELDDLFASFRLPELLAPEVQAELTKPEIVETLASAKVNSSPIGAALHKAHLLTGPNYRLARSLGIYLDVNQAGRLEAIEELIGTKLEFSDMSEDDEDEEDEEEE